jgi:hypothetical protein
MDEQGLTLRDLMLNLEFGGDEGDLFLSFFILA